MVMSWNPKRPFARRLPELSIPTHFRCPISLELMKDPVTLPTGITYDRLSIETWIQMGNSACPVTNQSLYTDDLIPNHTIRRMIQNWCVANRSLGVERIPTPRSPLTAAQVSDILSQISMAARRGDETQCLQLVAKMKDLSKESERNKKCIVSNGAAQVLASTFAAMPLESVLSALIDMFPLDDEARRHLGSSNSLNNIVLILENGLNLSSRLNAVMAIRDLVSSGRAATVASTNGLVEAIVKLIKEPISPQMTKASLVASFYLVSSSEETAARFVEEGLVPTLIELLVDAEKSISEKALAVLDGMLSCEKGREVACGHALAVPVLVKKMHRVSEAATEFSVSALWKMLGKGRKEGGGGGRVVEALQVGAFQKLLLLLQVGCSEGTKERASNLLRVLNTCRLKGGECIESMDFKGLKRNF